MNGGNKNEDKFELLSQQLDVNNETTTPSETELPYPDVQREPPSYGIPNSASTAEPIIPQFDPVESGTINSQNEAVNTVVVQQQPCLDTTLPTISPISKATVDWTFGVSIFLCVLCLLCGSWLTLLCFIPAIGLSSSVRVCYNTS